MKTIIYLLLFICPFISFSQSNFQSGFIVTLAGDTLQGEIDVKEWNFSPNQITFKSAVDGSTKYYTVEEISHFEIPQKEVYQRFFTSISQATESLSDIQGLDTSTKKKAVFMQMVYSGKKLNLYSYTDNIKQRFYILKTNQTVPIELIRRIYYADMNRLSLVNDNLYRTQLSSAIFEEYPYNEALAKKINRIDYNEVGLKKVIANADGENSKQQEKQIKSGQTFRLNLGAGVQKMDGKFNKSVFPPSQAGGTTTPANATLAAGFDYIPHPNSGKFLIRFEVAYGKNEISVNGTTGVTAKALYELKTSSVSLLPVFTYNIFSTKKFKVPVGYGLGFFRSKYDRNRFTETFTSPFVGQSVQENYFSYNRFHTRFNFEIGAVIVDKIRLLASYQSVSPSFARSSNSPNILQLKLYYLFSKKME